MPSNGGAPWRIVGDEVGSCNCVWACPCQFDADPSEGNCHALIGYSITEGNHGDTDLAGVKFASIVSWPGAIHEGDGTAQLVIDESTNEDQRAAIIDINSGQNGGEYFEIFASVLPHARDPIFAPIEIDSDRERRVASIKVGDIGDARIEPIKNPVTGDHHRVRIDLPDGFEYKQAEVGNTVNARVSGESPLDFTLEGTYGQLNPFEWNN